MKTVRILVLTNCTPLAPIGAMVILDKAGQFHQAIHGHDRPFFDAQLVSLRDQYVVASGNYPVYCHTQIDQIETCDLLIVPAIEDDIENKLQQNAALLPHLHRLYTSGTEIASLCTGSFVLAHAGLLHNKTATTHWLVANQLKQKHPDITVLDHKIVTDEKGIYTCGGATSYASLMLYIIEKFCGKETALATSKYLLLDLDRVSQLPYMIFGPQQNHDDNAILKAQQWASKQLPLPSVSEMAEIAGLSRRNFIRRFQVATGSTPKDFLSKLAVEFVKKSLESSTSSFSQAVYQLGYNDLSSFRKLFKRSTGLTPQNYKEKFGRSFVSLY